MTVRLVDMQTMVPRLTEASRLQHNSDVQPQVAQHAQAAQGQQRVERQQRQVIQRSPTEQATVARDGRQGGGGAGGQHLPQRRPKSEAHGEEPAGPRPGNRLDVKL